jgi:hypothetical protein
MSSSSSSSLRSRTSPVCGGGSSSRKVVVVSSDINASERGEERTDHALRRHGKLFVAQVFWTVIAPCEFLAPQFLSAAVLLSSQLSVFSHSVSKSL